MYSNRLRKLSTCGMGKKLSAIENCMQDLSCQRWHFITETDDDIDTHYSPRVGAINDTEVVSGRLLQPNMTCPVWWIQIDPDCYSVQTFENSLPSGIEATCTNKTRGPVTLQLSEVMQTTHAVLKHLNECTVHSNTDTCYEKGLTGDSR